MNDKQADQSVPQATYLGQRIRRLARRDGLVARKSRRDGKWFLSDEHNMLVSPKDGLDDDEAIGFLKTT
jgi:hypothetical protein